MKIWLAIAALFLVFAAPAQGASSNVGKEYFENILTRLCQIGPCNERPNPWREDEAADIVGNSVILAYQDDAQKIDEFNRPLREMGVEYGALVPAKQVEEAICRYYGFTQGAYEELNKAAERRKFSGDFYYLGPGDPGIVEFRVEKIDHLKNGLVRVNGISGEDEPFKAFFKKANCGGQEHWVPLKLVFTNIPEEADDFRIQPDK